MLRRCHATACHAIWKSFSTIHSLESPSLQVNVLAILMIRVGFELATGWVTLSWCHKRIPADFRMMLPQYVSKPVCYFYLGAVMYHMVCFYPSCQLCLQPQHCLLYLKCLRHGTLILDGREACRISFGWTAKAVEDILHASNISRSDMGCSREHVSCPTLKHLPPGQECKREADARDCFDDE